MFNPENFDRNISPENRLKVWKAAVSGSALIICSRKNLPSADWGYKIVHSGVLLVLGTIIIFFHLSLFQRWQLPLFPAEDVNVVAVWLVPSLHLCSRTVCLWLIWWHERKGLCAGCPQLEDIYFRSEIRDALLKAWWATVVLKVIFGGLTRLLITVFSFSPPRCGEAKIKLVQCMARKAWVGI